MTTRSLKYWYITQDMLLYTYFILTEIVHVTRDFNKDVNVNVLCIVEKAGDSVHTLDAYGCTSSWLSKKLCGKEALSFSSSKLINS